MNSRYSTIFEGQRFGAWQVIEPLIRDEIPKKSLCRCDCGTVREVVTANLFNETSRSCGCLRHIHIATNNSSLKYKIAGKTLRLKEISELSGIPYSTLYNRVSYRKIDIKEACKMNGIDICELVERKYKYGCI